MFGDLVRLILEMLRHFIYNYISYGTSSQSQKDSEMSQYEMSSMTSLDIDLNRIIKTVIPNPDIH